MCGGAPPSVPLGGLKSRKFSRARILRSCASARRRCRRSRHRRIAAFSFSLIAWPSVLSSAGRHVSPMPPPRHGPEQATPVALAAPGALGALVVVGHLDLAPVVPSDPAAPAAGFPGCGG